MCGASVARSTSTKSTGGSCSGARRTASAWARRLPGASWTTSVVHEDTGRDHELYGPRVRRRGAPELVTPGKTSRPFWLTHRCRAKSVRGPGQVDRTAIRQEPVLTDSRTLQDRPRG